MSAGGDAGRLEGADYGLLIDRKRPVSYTHLTLPTILLV